MVLTPILIYNAAELAQSYDVKHADQMLWSYQFFHCSTRYIWYFSFFFIIPCYFCFIYLFFSYFFSLLLRLFSVSFLLLELFFFSLFFFFVISRNIFSMNYKKEKSKKGSFFFHKINVEVFFMLLKFIFPPPLTIWMYVWEECNLFFTFN